MHANQSSAPRAAATIGLSSHAITALMRPSVGDGRFNAADYRFPNDGDLHAMTIAMSASERAAFVAAIGNHAVVVTPAAEAGVRIGAELGRTVDASGLIRTTEYAVIDFHPQAGFCVLGWNNTMGATSPRAA